MTTGSRREVIVFANTRLELNLYLYILFLRCLFLFHLVFLRSLLFEDCLQIQLLEWIHIFKIIFKKRIVIAWIVKHKYCVLNLRKLVIYVLFSYN